MTNCEFFLIRYVPDLIKNEPVNIGLVMLDSQGFTQTADLLIAKLPNVLELSLPLLHSAASARRESVYRGKKCF